MREEFRCKICNTPLESDDLEFGLCKDCQEIADFEIDIANEMDFDPSYYLPDEHEY